MNEIFSNLFKQILMLLPFILLALGLVKNNLQKPQRSKQFIMPVAALVFSIAVMFALNPIAEMILDLLYQIPEWIKDIADGLRDVKWLPDAIVPWLDKAEKYVRDLLADINVPFWVFFIANSLILLVYTILKKIALGIIKGVVKDDGKIHLRIAEVFYEFFPERNVWTVKDSYGEARSYLKVFYFGSLALSCILMLVSAHFYKTGLLRALYYPVFGVMIVGELWFYLDGVTRKEYSENIIGEDEEAYKTVNYSLMRKVLRGKFGDKLLAENTDVNDSPASDLTDEELVMELEKDEDRKIQCFAAYVKALSAAGFPLDHNYVRSTIDLLNEKSVLFNNPFYRDLIPYAFYPMNRVLLSHRKVLVVLGRHGIEEDIEQWIADGVDAVTNIPSMWSVGCLGKCQDAPDIGILTRSDVFNLELHDKYNDFFSDVGYCVIIEPSKLITTAQIGLNIIAKRCSDNGEKVIGYCMCDKNCDGLVDSISHILMTSITEVSATKHPFGTVSYMCWETDEEHLQHRIVPNISRYLGIGTELSLVALKNQIGNTRWYGGEAFPVTDIGWIGNQYYYDLMKYAGLPASQDVMSERIRLYADMWSAKTETNSYITVEDEASNMFEVLRDFSTRAKEQGFINIISSEYLLKDYMADNASIFETDAKAIPYIVADSVRTARNTVMKLLLMMTHRPVSEETLTKELSLVGIKVRNLREQLWHEIYKCYSNMNDVAALPENYEKAVKLTKNRPIVIGGDKYYEHILIIEDRFNFKRGAMETTYSIRDRNFIEHCVSALQSAGYVAEDEKGEKYYLGAELRGHIYQKYLPGQFFTFNGKYYEMQYLTADGQVLVRRAADHINGRPTYRQKRHYSISGVKSSERIGSRQNIEGMKVIREYADVSVTTPGYYLMARHNDFRTTKFVEFEGEKTGVPVREYHNKEILRIELPAKDGKLTDKVRYTITLLFNEVFKTIFAENQAYIVAVTDESFLREDMEFRPLAYSIGAEGTEICKNCIYIIEDSQLDLGLISAVERNIRRIFAIIEDYLDWNADAIEKSLNPPPPPPPTVTFGGDGEDGDGKKKKGGFFRRIWEKIKGFFARIFAWFKKLFSKLFKRKKKDKAPEGENEGGVPAEGENEGGTGNGTEDGAEDGTAEDADEGENTEFTKEKPEGENTDSNNSEGDNSEDNSEEAEEEENSESTEEAEASDKPEETDKSEETEDSEEPEEGEDSAEDANPSMLGSMSAFAQSDDDSEGGEVVVTEGEDGITYVIEEDDAEKPGEAGGISVERKPYHERYYLLYGHKSILEELDIKGVSEYIRAIGFGANHLKQAREGKRTAEYIEQTYKPDQPGVRYCDFCGCEIMGVEYETLADGRERCTDCGKTAIKTGKDFCKLFEEVKRNMESFYNIRINVGIRVEMVNTKKLQKRMGKAFVPTPRYDPRVIGLAIHDRNGYTLLIENGSPRMASMLTMAHELTHIWQYISWDRDKIIKTYGKDMRLDIYEGMAEWAQIQYAYLINEPAHAKREEILTARRDDEYGHGFIRYRENYPLCTGTVLTGDNPFRHPEMPLDKKYCGPITPVSDEQPEPEEGSEG